MLALLALAGAIALASCGGSGGSTSTSSPSATTGSTSTTTSPSTHAAKRILALTKYLPSDTPAIRTANVKAAADELGISSGTDPFVVPDSQTSLNDSSVQFSLVAAVAFGPYEQEFQFAKANPVADAFDGSAISSGASNFLDTNEPVSVIRTSQSFDEIAKSLEKSGFTRKGDSLTAAHPTQTQYSSVADAGHGVVVVAANQADAGDLVASPPGGPTGLEALVAPADKPIAVAVTEPSSQCVQQLGGWNDTSGDGVMRLTIQGGANADAIALDALDDTAIDPGTPKVDGDTIEIPFTKRGSNPMPSASPLQDAIVKVAITKLYDCP